ncbi:MAG: asparagine synthase (glutamine-hydrolyzing) [Gemmatimonadales bacterium]|nr:asparagine synthase (glutamine-hydrolyzing) [Gemmatimonadales bacterium]
MCGICGVVARETLASRVDAGTVTRMRDVLLHRGPDGAGLFHEPAIALGHRRLSIIDPAAGHQPMASDDGRFQIVYNGEVFNHPSLKADLEAQGVRYRTRCDTETVLHLYEREGERAVERLRGMFAIALWDRARRELFLARDRFGVKPLYYVHDADGTLWFASEIKALVAAGAVRPALDLAQLPDQLANHAPSGEGTLFQGVRRLPAGHTLLWRDGQVTIRRYWDLPRPEGDRLLRDADVVAEYRERLEEAVRLRLMSDVPLGAFLSGGIDSAAVTAIMSRLTDAPVRTFSVAFAEREANELAYARMVAERFRCDHHEVVLSPQEFFGLLPRMVWHEDEPLAHPSSIPLHVVARLAGQHVKVVLTGEGSDEMLAGYNRYRVALLSLRAGRLYEAAVPAVARRAVGARLAAMAPRSRTARRLHRTFLGRSADLDALYFENFAVFPRAWQQRLLAGGTRAATAGLDPYAAMHHAYDAWDGAPPLERLLYMDAKTYLHELLMKQDQMSMAASIESRVPFLDHPLCEWTMRLPSRFKLRGVTTKWVLREAMRDTLPAEILSRKKMGFPVPVGAWLRGPFRALLERVVLSERALRRDVLDAGAVRQLVAAHVGGEMGHEERVWMLLNLELWHRLFVDGEPLDAVEAEVRGLAA